MAEHSVTDFSSFINLQIESQGRVEACIWRLEALIEVAVTVQGLYNLPDRILHNYFSVVGDLINEASMANHTSLNELLKFNQWISALLAT